jgi:hypothetical protein
MIPSTMATTIPNINNQKLQVLYSGLLVLSAIRFNDSLSVPGVKRPPMLIFLVATIFILSLCFLYN